MILTVISVSGATSMCTSAVVAGIAMPTRISTGMMVQAISARVLWAHLAGSSPRDLRCRMIDMNIAAKTRTPMTTQIHRTTIWSR